MNQQEQIFHKWISEFKPLLFKIVRVYSKGVEDENDLFQEITIQLWKSIRNFKNQSSPHTWIYRVALNTALKWSSKQKTVVTLDENEILIHPQENNDQLDWLYSEISRLDKVDRSLTLLMLDGFSYKEMSAILGISTSHVGVKISRIKAELQKRSKLITQ